MTDRFGGPAGIARINALALALSISLAVWVFAGPGRGPVPIREARELLALVPEDSALVATVDLARLRGGPLARSLLRSGEAGALGGACGDFDPLAHADALVLALPRGGGASDPSVVAMGRWDSARLVECVAKNAGGLDGPADTSTFRGFTVIRARREGDAEVAVHPRGLVLLAGGRQLRELLDVVDSKAPSAARSEAHRRLRARMGNEGTLLASWLVPEGWLVPFGTEALRSPLAGVRAIAIRVDVTTEVRARVVLEHETPSAAEAVEDVARRLKADGASLRLLGFGFVGDAEIRRTGAEVEVAATLGVGELEILMKRLEAADG